MSRLLDVLVSSLVLLLFLPFALLIAFLLRLTGEGEIFYCQDRVGKGGGLFRLLKFATMLKNSPHIGTGTVTVKDDPRVLWVGRFLRKTKLNEMPQFWNVLVGDMGLVGPRPLTPQTFSYYPEDVRQQISALRPGLTGVGSIIFRDEERILGRSPKAPLDCYREDIAPYKGALELWYAGKRSFWLDVKLMFLTVWVVFRPSSQAPFRCLKGIPEEPPALRG